MVHSQTYYDLRHDFFRVCSVVACCSALSNVLPHASIFGKHKQLRNAYCWMIDLIAACALNWRTRLPSLDQEFMGFTRRVRHGYANWQQHRLDRREHDGSSERNKVGSRITTIDNTSPGRTRSDGS